MYGKGVLKKLIVMSLAVTMMITGTGISVFADAVADPSAENLTSAATGDNTAPAEQGQKQNESTQVDEGQESLTDSQNDQDVQDSASAQDAQQGDPQSNEEESVPEDAEPADETSQNTLRAPLLKAPARGGAIYVSSAGNDETGDGSEENPYATISKAYEASSSGAVIKLLTDIEMGKFVYIMHDVTIDGQGKKITRADGDGFATTSDTGRSWYNPGMFEVHPDDNDVTVTFRNVTIDEAFKHNGSTYKFQAAGSDTSDNLNRVQDGIISMYYADGSHKATAILENGTSLKNFGGMTAVRVQGGNELVMKSGSVIDNGGAKKTSVPENSGEAGAVTTQNGILTMEPGSKICGIKGVNSITSNGGTINVDGEITGCNSGAMIRPMGLTHLTLGKNSEIHDVTTSLCVVYGNGCAEGTVFDIDGKIHDVTCSSPKRGGIWPSNSGSNITVNITENAEFYNIPGQAIRSDLGTTVNMSGGSIHDSGAALFIRKGVTCNITGGEIKNNTFGVILANDGTNKARINVNSADEVVEGNTYDYFIDRSNLGYENGSWMYFSAEKLAESPMVVMGDMNADNYAAAVTVDKQITIPASNGCMYLGNASNPSLTALRNEASSLSLTNERASWWCRNDADKIDLDVSAVPNLNDEPLYALYVPVDAAGAPVSGAKVLCVPAEKSGDTISVSLSTSDSADCAGYSVMLAQATPPTYKITINYLDKSTNQPIAGVDPYTADYVKDSNYDVTSQAKKDIEGYSYDSADGDLTGTITEDLTINAYYNPPMPVNINHGKQYPDIYSAMLEAEDGDVIYVRGYDNNAEVVEPRDSSNKQKTIKVNKNVTIVADPDSPHDNPISKDAKFEVAAGKTLTMGDTAKSTKTLTLNEASYTVKGIMDLNDKTEITQTSTASVISVDSSGALNVNGGSVTTEKGKAVYNNGGATTIAGGTLAGKGSYATVENRNNGTLTITEGTITAANHNAIDNLATITEISGGTITGGKVTTSNPERNGAIRNETTGTITKISGGTITANDGSQAAIGNEGNIVSIEGGTFNGSNYALYNKGKDGTENGKIDAISGGTFKIDLDNGTAFYSEKGKLGTISGGEYTAKMGISLNGGTIEKITGGKVTSGESAAIKIAGKLTVPEISGATFESTKDAQYSYGIWVSGSSKVEKIENVATCKGQRTALCIDNSCSVGTITDSNFEAAGSEGSTYRRGIYIGHTAGIDSISNSTVKGKQEGIVLTGQTDAAKTSYIGTIDSVTINAEDHGIHMGSTGTMYTHIGEIKGDTKITNTTNNAAIYLVNSGASIDKITGVEINAVGSGISNDGGTIEEITSADKGDVTIKSKQSAIHNYGNGVIGLIAGYGIYETQGASAIVNAKQAVIKLESDGAYDLATEQPNVGYGSYKSSNASKVIDDASVFDITDGYAMSKITHDDGYYHLVKQLTVTFDPDGGTPDPDDQTVGYGEKATKPDDPAKTGYEFAGWINKATETVFDIANTAVKENLELKAKWGANQYTVKFDNNTGSGEMADQEFTYDVEQALTANSFTKEGYTYTGWNTKADGSGDAYTDKQAVKNLTTENGATVTLYAQWTPNKYIVKFENNTGSGEMADQEFTYDVEQALTANSFTKEGYTYTGWNTKADGTGTAYEDKKSVKNLTAENGATVTLYAQWKVNQYTITFDSNGGSPVDPITQGYGTDVTAPKDPTREGYTFTGWDPEVPGTMPAKDMKVKAKWNVNQYKVTYKYIGDEPAGASKLPADELHDFGSEVTVADPATAPGYTFSGWSRKDFTMPAENVEITGTFTANGDTPYKVEHYTEKLGGGYELADTEEHKGETNTEATANPKTYEGFSLNDKAEGAVASGKIAADGSLVLKLYYDRNEYTITFDSNGGSPVDPITQAYGTDVTAPKDPVREGYTFGGWEPKLPDKMPAKDMTVTAKWTPIEYTITFDTKGGSKIDPITQDYGTDVTAPKDPTREGYTFDGWEPAVPKTMPAENMTLAAKWKVNQYKVTYKYLGEVPTGASELPADALYDFGSKVKVADPATASGYTFSGWSKEDFTMPAEDVEITGTFTAKGDTPYKVEHYKEMTEDGKYQLAETEDFTGKTGATATANPKTYEGFSLNEKAGGAVESGTIAADGSLVLKLFYDRDDCAITYSLNGGSYNGSTDDITEEHKYGEEIAIHEAPERDGYTFVEWRGSSYQPGDKYTVVADHTFEAIWEEAAAPDDDDEEEEEEAEEPEDTAKPDKAKDKGVKTGDETDLMAIGGIFGASLLGLLAMIRRRKREQQ